MICEKRIDYYHQLARKLIDRSTSCKTSILKNVCNNKKIPLILPLLIANKLVSNFREKANHNDDILKILEQLIQTKPIYMMKYLQKRLKFVIMQLMSPYL